MQEIAKTDLYILSVDTEKNRLYQIIQGNWTAPAENYRYIEELKQTLNLLSPGFTCLNDGSQGGLMSQKWTKIAAKARLMLVEAGIAKIAEILAESELLKLQIGRVSRQAGIITKIFADRHEAETWLDRE